jgi:hypothetical protein
MSNDIQQETERIHQNIVESISFLDALANRDAEIARLRKELEGADRVANDFAQTACLRAEEIERLRSELIKERLLVRHIDQVNAALAANQEQEINRLLSLVERGVEIVGNVPEGAWNDWVGIAEEVLSDLPVRQSNEPPT